MTIYRALKTLIREYEKVKDKPNVQDPVVYALFVTWKQSTKEQRKNDE